MSDIKLFQLGTDGVQELHSSPAAFEKSLQSIFEHNLGSLLGVRFLASEYSTGAKHRGRIDTLGIDENNCPVIIEYKRNKNENVINQGLFYLDWLMDHRSEFELLVLKMYGEDAKGNIEWAAPRLICIASDFTRYDEHAVYQINRNIELMRYKLYGEQYVILELVNQPYVQNSQNPAEQTATPHSGVPDKEHKGTSTSKSALQALENANIATQELYNSLRKTLHSFGDDVSEKPLKAYIAFTRIRNFVTLWTHKDHITMWVKLDPATITLEKGFTRDVREIGHAGVGNLEITINSIAALTKAEALLLQAYEEA